MAFVKKIITFLFFGNKYALGIKKIGKNSKIGLFRNILNGQYISIGNNSFIGRYSKIQCWDYFCKKKYYPRLIILDEVSIGSHFTCWCADECIIEDNVTIASYCTITNENHGTNVEDSLSYRKQKLVTKKVVIGAGSWLGERVIVLPGVSVGKKCIIGAGSIVTKNIPDYSIATGNPAKVIKVWDFNKHMWVKYNDRKNN